MKEIKEEEAMIQEFKIEEADGIVLSETIKLQGEIYPKGYKLNANDIKEWKELGVDVISGMQLQEGDISSNLALEIIGTKLSGSNVSYILDEEGTLKFAALEDGIFRVEENRIAKFNKMSNIFVLNTISPYSNVKAGDIIGILEILPPFVSQSKIDEIKLNLSGNFAMMTVMPEKQYKAALIYARFYTNKEENSYFTKQVKQLVKHLSRLNLEFSEEYEADYNSQAVGDAIQQAENQGNEVIFIISSIRTGGETDVIPQAMKSYVDEFICCQTAQINMSDMFVGEKRKSRVINLPYNYYREDCSLVDEMIIKSIINEKLIPTDYINKQNIILSKNYELDKNERLLLQNHGDEKTDSEEAKVAVVILAAGVSSRTKRNKLLITKENGEPLFMDSVKAAIASKAAPVFVITGHQHEEVEEYLENIDVNVIYNPNYRQGIKTSINLGLSLVPNICQGAILLPADMPNVTTKHINKMIEAFDAQEEKRVVVTNFKGVKRNPILWSRSLFEIADLVPENSGIRTVFAEHEDYMTLINAGSEKLILDVNYPSDIDILEKGKD